MHHHDSSFSVEESLQLINDMIGQAKQEYEAKSFFFLLWGWLLLLTGIGQYLLLPRFPELAGWVWFAQGVIGGIISAISGPGRRGKPRRVSSHLNKFILNIWLAFGITLFFIIFSSVQSGADPIAFVLLLTGLPTYVTGAVLRFRPLKLGGMSFWVLGIVSLFVPQPYRSLVFSLAILLGYLIPGYLLKQNENRRVRVQGS